MPPNGCDAALLVHVCFNAVSGWVGMLVCTSPLLGAQLLRVAISSLLCAIAAQVRIVDPVAEPDVTCYEGLSGFAPPPAQLSIFVSLIACVVGSLVVLLGC